MPSKAPPKAHVFFNNVRDEIIPILIYYRDGYLGGGFNHFLFSPLLGGSLFRIPKDMGMVWEASHKGVPLLGVPGITLDCFRPRKKPSTKSGPFWTLGHWLGVWPDETFLEPIGM